MDPTERTSTHSRVDRLVVKRTGSDGAVLLELEGELDLASGSVMQRELRRGQELAARELVIDLGGVSFMDSTGVSCLVGALCHAEGNRYALRLRRLPPQARRVLEMSGVLDRFDVID